jgi:hypothetical protein
MLEQTVPYTVRVVRRAARYSVGGIPTWRLNTLLKRGIEPNPAA